MKIITIKKTVETKFKEKESLFIGKAFPVSKNEEAEDILSAVKKEYFDATHHCFAYKIYDQGEKYSDDGEPSGTAGKRLLNAINHFNLTNVIIISVRYFGGKKLGVGPLGKAYYRSGFETLDSAEKIELSEYNKLVITYPYEQTKNIHHFLNKYDAVIKENLFEELPKIVILIKSENFESFNNELLSASNRTININKDKATFFIG
jgi:uncharacterized YigZ family protein